MSHCLAQRRDAAAKLVRGVSSNIQAAYSASAKCGALRYGEIDAKDVLALIERFCVPLCRSDGEFWDLGSGSGNLVLTASLVLKQVCLCGGIEIQDSLNSLATASVISLNSALTVSTTEKEEAADEEKNDKKFSDDLAIEFANLNAIPDSVENLAEMLVSRLGHKRYKAALKGNATLTKYLLRQLGRRETNNWQTGHILITLDINTKAITFTSARNGLISSKEKEPRSLQSQSIKNKKKKIPITSLVRFWQASAGRDEAKEIKFICGDLFDTVNVWAPNASIIFANILLFDSDLIARFIQIITTHLREGTFVISSVRLNHPILNPKHSDVWCRASWTGGVKLYFYNVLSPLSVDSDDHSFETVETTQGQ
uniref:DOT1 domain-containing protein n=1 Tax=Aureoumbra lagunensis TaxID=44058 RepID=A0A7S3K3F4_9STRA|mmetsp:Transcript_3546/g.4643  ORF Transcript_3546/g.4643 Transcript_3546/m.4643 type:complete len:369 (-) Transcript_3546:183-1289(-)